ncbi:MAG TPA: hypothetical protein VIL69_14540 [Roseomonas sp.]|jgi:hypothetical protein
MTSVEAPSLSRQQIETIEYERLADFKLKPGKFIYHIKGERLPIYLFGKFRRTSVPLIVFGQGMIDRSQIQLPRFQRLDWSEAFPENILIISDPTLFLAEDMTLGWLLGTHDHYMMPRIAQIVMRARDQLRIEDRNILFYGTSAGGFSSMMLSTQFDDPAVLVNNPQTDVLKFSRGGVSRLLQLAFDGLSRNEAEKRFGSRLSFVQALSEGARLPRLYYLQNLLDDDHYNDQLLPLMRLATKPAQSKGGTHLERRFIVDLYIDQKTLHNPLGLSRVKTCMDIVRSWITTAA